LPQTPWGAALRDTSPQQQRPQHAPVGDPRLHVRRAEAERPHDVDRRRDQLGIRERPRLADDVHVELKVLAQSPPLLPFVAEQLGDREPADRLLEGLGVGGHHAGQRGGHFGPQRHVAVAFVPKRIQLLHDFVAALLGVELQGLERGPSYSSKP